MPGHRLRRALPLIVLAACAPTASRVDQAGASPSRRNCGFEAARRAYLAPIAEREAAPRERRLAAACEPPSEEEIASTCEIQEAVRSEPEGEFDPPDIEMPDYRVRGARCRLIGRNRSEAYCRFELGNAGSAPAWRKVRMRFRYRYAIISDEMGHPLEFASWFADGVCTAGEAPATH